MSAEALEYDPYSYELDVDPYPVYRRMQDEAPAYYNERLDFWALTRFDDVLAAFLDWRRFSSARGTVLELMDKDVRAPLIIFMDPPRQTRLRNLVSKAFTPRCIAELEPQIRGIAAGYLDALVGRPRCDIVKEFTARLPMDVISALLGIPPEDRDSVQGWSNDILHRRDALAERRRRPREDMMTALTQAELRNEEGQLERLSDLEIRSFFNLLATAGNETVTKFLASALYWLAHNPGERRRLRDDPGLIPSAVEETLRYDPPSHYQGRTLKQDVELHDRKLPAGARVLLINGATGRDPRRFPDPDRYDVGRAIDLHLGFGHGQHICLGASLARLESRIALEEFFRRFGEYAVPEEGIERMHSSNVRGFKALELELG
jgi:cytochrome P450